MISCTSTTPRQQRFLRWLLAITCLALALRLAVSFALVDHPSVINPDPRTDMATYQEFAQRIAHGNWPDHFYYQPFYYAVFLPAVYCTLGEGAWTVPVVQSLLGAATVVLAGLAAARLWGRRCGLFAAVLTTLSHMLIFYTPFTLIASLQTFWVTLFVWLLVRAAGRRDRWRWLAVAAALAGAVLTRGNALLLAVLPLWLIWQETFSPRQPAAARNRRLLGAGVTTVLFLAVLFLPQLPFALRNFAYYGRWTGPSSAADAVLALSNSPQAPPGGLAPDTLVFEEWMRTAGADGNERIPVSRRVLAWAARSPLAVAELKFQTLLLFWSGLEIPNNVSLAYEGRAAPLLRMPFPFLLDFTFLGTLALSGLLLSLPRLRSSQRLAVVFGVVAVYCVATVMFYMLARFRVIAVPVLCVFAAYALERGVRLTMRFLEGRTGLRKEAILFAGSLIVGGYVCGAAFTQYQRIEPAVMKMVRPQGTSFRYRDGWVLQDHGPQVTGGWRPLDQPGHTGQLGKTFAIPNSLRSAQPVAVETAFFDLDTEKIRWVKQSVDGTIPDAGLLTVDVPVPAGHLPVLDLDRWYGRTELERSERPPGEAVARLFLHDTGQGER